jgi:hypothetical protein
MYNAALAAVPRVFYIVELALSVDDDRVLELVAKQFADHAHLDHGI